MFLGWVLWNLLVGPCIQQLFSLLVVICSVHNYQGYPLVCSKYDSFLVFFNSFRALYSCFEMLEDGLGLHCTLFKAFFTSTLISSASPLSNLEQACSTATMYSLTGGCLGLIENFGPQARSLSCSSDNGIEERFLTHLFLSSVSVSLISLFWELPIFTWFEWPPSFHCIKPSNLAFCLLITLLCLYSLTLTIKILHSSRILWSSFSNNISFTLFEHVSLFNMSSSIVLVIDLMHSFKSCFSAFLIIWIPLGVFIFVLSLTLTGIASFLRHLIVNLRWRWGPLIQINTCIGNSHHAINNKYSIISTLLHRAKNICSNKEMLEEEYNYIHKALTACKYPRWAIRRMKLKLDAPKTRQNRKNTQTNHKCHITVPYEEGLSETIKNIGKKYGIEVHFRSGKTLKDELVAPKDKDHITNKSCILYWFKCDRLECDEEYIGETARTFRDKLKEHLKAPSPIYDHSNTTGHNVNINNFSIVGREEQNLSRLIKESMFIRVNNPSLNKNIGKYHLPHVWDEVLINNIELKLK